jgi:hypothetical protein
MILQAKIGNKEVFVNVVDLTSFVHAESTSPVFVYGKNDGKVGRVEKAALSDISFLPEVPAYF